MPSWELATVVLLMAMGGCMAVVLAHIGTARRPVVRRTYCPCGRPRPCSYPDHEDRPQVVTRWQ